MLTGKKRFLEIDVMKNKSLIAAILILIIGAGLGLWYSQYKSKIQVTPVAELNSDQPPQQVQGQPPQMQQQQLQQQQMMQQMQMMQRYEEEKKRNSR